MLPSMGALRDPGELRDVPAVAVCATCGDPSCAGHDFEASGERPVRRWLPWEDGETPPLRALWRTAMTSASDLDLWVRASSRTDGGIGPAFAFALACESVAVASTTVPLAIGGGVLAWSATHSFAVVRLILALALRIGAGFVPLMLVIHVVYQWSLARAGTRLGKAAPPGAAVRAGFYACGWDLATGPAGVLASLFIGEWRQARTRARGNSTLFADATNAWLLTVHEVEGERAHLARRATRPWMALLVVGAVLMTGWAFVATLR